MGQFCPKLKGERRSEIRETAGKKSRTKNNEEQIQCGIGQIEGEVELKEKEEIE